MNPLVDRLAWDSEHFGVAIGRVRAEGLDLVTAREAVESAREERIQCLYLLVDADDGAGVLAAQEVGFRLTDLRLTLERSVAGGDGDRAATIRLARDEDLAILEGVAANAHVDSRFFFDEHFDDGAAADLYRRWLRGSVTGELADIVFVADVEARASGYITGSVDEEAQTVSIGLLAVAPWARGRGLGGQLVAALLAEVAARGANRVTVVTQGRNVAAQRLYQAAGFRTERLQLWFHRWEDGDPEG